VTRRVVPRAWALIGKVPGDRDDYRILRGSSSGRDDDNDLADQVWAELPGIPQLGSMPGPGALPWVTFTPREEDGQHWMAVTAVDATADRDAVGRPAVAIRHIRLSFADMAQDRTGYRALYAAVPPAPDMTPPLTLELPGPDDAAGAVDATVASLADGKCFDRTARLAALLLAGEVMITLSNESTLPVAERLAEFDRVMMLLPFGMRAGIALASWHDGSLREDTPREEAPPIPFRLAFGPFRTGGQAAVRHGGEISPPADGIADRYLRELAAVRKEFGLSALIAHLGRHRAPLAPEDPAQAWEILRSLADPGLVVAAVREGRASVERVLNARRHEGRRLDQFALDELDEYLLAQDDPAAGREVLDRWSDRTAQLAARAVLGQLAAGDAIPAARRLYAHAADHGEQETFLAAIAERRTRDGAVVPAAPVAALIYELTEPPHRGELPAVRAAVLRQPRLARWQLRLSLRGDRDARAWLEWLSPAAGETAPEWLRPYVWLTTPQTTPPNPGDIEAAPEDLALIASFALRDDPVSLLTGPWWPVLLRLARGDPAERATAQARMDLAALAEAAALGRKPPLPSAVRLDTLRLYVGLTPRYLPLTAGAPSCLRYLDALWELWSQPPADGDLTTLTVRLLGSLPKGPFGEEALTLLRAVVTDDRIPFDGAIADTVAEIVAATHGLTEDPRLTADWWARVERLRPDVRAPRVRLRAAVRRPDTDPVEVAVLMGNTAASGVSPEDLHAITWRWLGRRAPEEVSSMLRIVDGVLRLCADPRRIASCEEYVASLARELDVSADRRSTTLFRRRAPDGN
jgi:hypothetical protein